MRKVVLALLIVAVAATVHAQPPNDDCAGALPVTVDPFGSCTPTAGSTSTATDDGTFSCDTATPNLGVWYSFTAPAAGSVLVDINEITGGHEFAVFDACGGTEVFCQSSETGVATGLTPGNTYYLIVWSDSFQPGDFELCVTDPPPLPANDDCADSTTVPVGPPGSCTPTPGSTFGATQDGTFSCDTTGVNNDVWYDFIAPTAGEVVINIEEVTGNHEAAVFDACGGTELACDITPQGTLVSGLTAGNSYKLAVWSDAGSEGSHNVCVNEFIPPTNEDCGTAEEVTAFPFSTSVDTSFAAAGGLPGSCNSTSAVEMQNDVWYTWTINADCDFDITVDPDAGGGYDGLAALYTGACGALTELDCIDTPEPHVFNVVGGVTGTTYYLQIGDWGTSAGGGITTVDIVEAIGSTCGVVPVELMSFSID